MSGLGCTHAGAPPTDTDSAVAVGGDTGAPGALHLPSLAGLNVIVIQVDTLRADHLPMYGYPRDTTPQLENHPWQVVVGERPTGPWTLPSSASFLTGLEPQHHLQLIYNQDHTTNAPLTAVTFPARLRDAGWDTALFSGNGVVSSYTGLDAGFEAVRFAFKGDPSGGPGGGGTMATLSASALAWLDQRVSVAPFMIHLQPMNMHQSLVIEEADLAAFRSERETVPKDQVGGYSYDAYANAYDHTSSDAAREALRLGLVDLYDAALLGLDREVARFLTELDGRGLLDRTVVVFTADHGETLDDTGRGAWGHGNSVREELTRVPWMVRVPGVSGSVTDCVSSNVDVWPTLWAAMGMPPLAGLDGVDLANGCRGEAASIHYEVEGLVEASVGNLRGKLAVACLRGSVAGTDVGSGADVTESTAVVDVAGGPFLLDGLHRHVDAFSEAVEGVDCRF